MFYDNTILETEALKELLEFIQFEKKENLILDTNFSIEPAQIEKESFYITEGKKRGLSTQFSKLLGVSRQSVEKAIKNRKYIWLKKFNYSYFKSYG